MKSGRHAGARRRPEGPDEGARGGGRNGRRRDAARRDGQEHQLLHGIHVIQEALRAQRRALHRLWLKRGPDREDLQAIAAQATALGIPIELASGEDLLLRADAGEASLQGALLEAGPLPELGSAGALARAAEGHGRRLLVALDGVEDPQNVGAIMRVADAAGARGVLLTHRRSPPLSPALCRASAGAAEWLPVARVPNLSRGLEELQREGFWLVGADPGASQSLFALPDRLLAGDLVVVLGAEGRGLRESVRKVVDHPAHLPMRGEVASLNVATAGAVFLFELMRRAGDPESR